MQVRGTAVRVMVGLHMEMGKAGREKQPIKGGKGKFMELVGRSWLWGMSGHTRSEGQKSLLWGSDIRPEL